MRVLIDTDVVLDLLLDRAEYADAAAQIWEANERKQFDGYVSAITPVNVFYIARKLKGAAIARQATAAILVSLRVCPLDALALRRALALPFADYEDAVQHASAAASALDAIVTRNTQDYLGATLPVLSPVDFLTRLRAPL